MGQRDLALASHGSPSALAGNDRVALALASAQFFIAGFHIAATGPVSPRLSAEWGVQPAELGILGSLLFYAYAGIQIPAGLLADALGSRRMFILSGLLMGLGTGIFGAAPNFQVAMLGRLFQGLGAGLIFTAGFRLISNITAHLPRAQEQFVARFGLLTGVNYLGVALASIPLVLVVNTFGWRVPLLFASFFSLGIALATWIAPGVNEVLHSPEGSRLKAAADTWRSKRTIWGYTLLRFLYGSFVGMQTLWVVPLLLITFGFDSTVAGIALLAMALGQAIGPGLGSWLTTRTGKLLQVLTVATGVYAASCLLLIVFLFVRPDVPWVIAALFALAVTQAATLIGYGLVTMRVARSLQGTVAGMVNVAPWLGTAFFQLAVGYLVQSLLQTSPPNTGNVYGAALVPLAITGVGALVMTRLL
ncbi:MAG TPA: MFS transporter [Anaerolineae bacterium]|nr:MFS transporter [Anaerolineae bacterium]